MKNIDFGKQLIEVRKSKGLTQEEVADRCNVTSRTIQRIESGAVTPRMSTVKIIADALDINLFDSNKKNSKLKNHTLIWYLKDLFNLKTHTMRKLSILSVLILSTILISIGLIDVNAQPQTDHPTSSHNEKTAKRNRSIDSSQIPIEKYRIEIENLKSENQIEEYWTEIHKIGQEILVNTTDLRIADSISISNMIKTTFLIDIHGFKGYNSNGFSGVVPILNLAHNSIGQSKIAYWSIIEECKKIGGAIDSFGGTYPAYELECISLTFYNYSLLYQEVLYPKLIEKLKNIKTESVINTLLESYKNQNKLRELREVFVLNEWYLESLKNRIDKKIFSFVKMSDGNIYKKSRRRIQKLELIKTNSESKIYRIENEPFGWTYEYGNDGSLTLINHEGDKLINYTHAK